MNESSDQPLQNNAQGSQKPLVARRVGTITVGLIFIVSGICMIIALFFPQVDLRVAIQLSPLALVSFGVEVLVSHAIYKDGNYKYDWASVLMSFFVVAVALCFALMSWGMLYGAALGYRF